VRTNAIVTEQDRFDVAYALFRLSKKWTGVGRPRKPSKREEN